MFCEPGPRSVPDREIEVITRLREVNSVQRAQHCTGIVHVRPHRSAEADLQDLLTRGRAERQSRPWLGVYAVELTGRIYVTGVADGSPAQVADIREGDLISQVGDREVATLAEFYRCLWSLGPAGIGVPLTTVRGGTNLHLTVRSVDRTDLLKRPQAH